MGNKDNRKKKYSRKGSHKKKRARLADELALEQNHSSADDSIREFEMIREENLGNDHQNPSQNITVGGDAQEMQDDVHSIEEQTMGHSDHSYDGDDGISNCDLVENTTSVPHNLNRSCGDKELLDSSDSGVYDDSVHRGASDHMQDFIHPRVEKNDPGARTLADMRYVFKQIFINLHEHYRSCRYPFEYFQLYDTRVQGLRKIYHFGCMHCGYVFKMWSEQKEPLCRMPIHESAVCGTLTAGIAYNTFKEVMASLDVHCPSEKVYRSYRDKVTPLIDEVHWESLRAAALEEAQLARAAGDVTADGIPFITVIVDGAWSKRSYVGGRYDALSGVAAIAGARTGKILFVGIRNKYCSFCDRAASLGINPRSHTCYKNYDRKQPSTAMEADILLEGFQSSIEMHGLIYNILIGDGDSSVYAKITSNDPYREHNVLVEKYECKNHLYRRFCKTIDNISRISLTIQPLPYGTVLPYRDRLKRNALKMRKYVMHLVDTYITADIPESEKVKGLANDITRMTSHFFGQHKDCEEGQESCLQINIDDVPILKKNGIWSSIEAAVSRLASNAKSLLKDVSTNPVEAFNSIGNKTLGGRRVFHGARNSYELRQKCSAVQFNSQRVLSQIHAHLGKSVPSVISKMENQKIAQARRTRASRAVRRTRPQPTNGNTSDLHYGLQARQPDKSDGELNAAQDRLLEKIRKFQEDRIQIEEETRAQRDSREWMYYRQYLLTASNFGAVCTMQPETSCHNRVKSILTSGKSVSTPAMVYGQKNESKAVKLLSEAINTAIDPCGLFIDKCLAFLGATPDGLIGDDGIAEVKCLWASRNLTIGEALATNRTVRSIFDKNDLNKMNASHKYYYQVQGQLHITERQYCMFAVMTDADFKYIRVEKDDTFWLEKMEPSLKRFYMECLLPELADSRLNRGLKVRDPPYILQAQERKAAEKAMKDAEKMRRVGEATKTSTDSGKKRTQPRSYKRKKSSGIDEDHNDSGHDNPQTIKKKRVEEEFSHDMNRETVAPETVNRNGNFIIVNDTERLVSQEEFDNSIETLVASINTIEVIDNVLAVDSLLWSDSIDLFLMILRENSHLNVFFSSCFPYPQYIQPSATKNDIHIIGGNRTGHWICLHYNGTQLRIYDSMNRPQLHQEEIQYIHLRYPNLEGVERVEVSQQPDGQSCGLYAAAFAIDLARNEEPGSIQYSQNIVDMRHHFINIVKTQRVIPFPRDSI